MISGDSNYKNILYLWKYFGRRRRFQLSLLFLLMVLSIFADIISVGSIIPFLSALTNPDILMSQKWFQPIIEFLNIKSSNDLMFPLTIGFVGASVIASLIKIVLLWFNNKLSGDIGIELETEVYDKILHQPYEYHISNNSSQLISLITKKIARTVYAAVTHVLMFVISIINSLAIIATLIFINPMIAFLTFFILGGGYLFIGSLVKKQISKNGEIISKYEPEGVKSIQEGLGGIREIILEHNQNIFLKNYRDIAYKLTIANIKNTFLGNLPKSLIEVLSISLIAILAYYMQVVEGEKQVLPVLGALALGAQKLLPSLQQIYFSWSVINATAPIINEVVGHLKRDISKDKIKDNKLIEFNNKIDLNNISYSYDNGKNKVLDNIDLSIKKGSKVGFIGKTGSGKSTLIDIIMGLLKPQAGSIKIDEKIIDENNIYQWQNRISHVPQVIFLSDATIAENIAFGVPKDQIDMDRVLDASKKASLDIFIQDLPLKYETMVGERGVQLSGGQRQRIGIARALYKKADVIVFDEATSALDDSTEKSVMEAINNLSDDLTILMIAHRLSTLKECNVIYKLDKGKIVLSGKYEDVISI